VNGETVDGLLKLLFVPSEPPTEVPVKPGTVDGLLRLEFVPSTPPAPVPVKPGTVDGLLKFALTPGTAVTGLGPAVVVALVVEPVPVFAPVLVVVLVGGGATSEEMPLAAGPPTADATICSALNAPPLAELPTLCASARTPASASAAPIASVKGLRRLPVIRIAAQASNRRSRSGLVEAAPGL